MKSITTFERLMSTTADGELIKVTTIYSSFDKEEIDNLQKELQKTIGAGITGFYKRCRNGKSNN